jgi:YggT family protein
LQLDGLGDKAAGLPMFVLANLLSATAAALDVVLKLYMWIVIARALISWVNPDPRNPIVRFLYNATEPLLYRVRRVVPYLGGIDFSPLVVIVAIIFLQSFLVGSLQELAFRMR